MPRAPGSQRARIVAAIEREVDALPWRRNRLGRLAKRALDLAVAVPVGVISAPVLGAVALLVRATSPGPVFFRQSRIGLDGTTFTMWKFRTMRADRVDGAAEGRSEVTRQDARLTPIGRLLRDWRLDELPQLFQVITGQMSLVGPRPDLESNLDAYRDDHLVRFAMPPGCTAWTFTRGAFANDWATRQSINAEYVKSWTIWLDVKVIVGTALVLVAQKNTSPELATIPETERERKL